MERKDYSLIIISKRYRILFKETDCIYYSIIIHSLYIIINSYPFIKSYIQVMLIGVGEKDQGVGIMK